MAEHRIPVRPVLIKMLCDSCPDGPPKGEMVPIKNAANWLVTPLVIPHQCDKCGATADFDKMYSYIGYEVIEQ